MRTLIVIAAVLSLGASGQKLLKETPMRITSMTGQVIIEVIDIPVQSVKPIKGQPQQHQFVLPKRPEEVDIIVHTEDGRKWKARWEETK